MRHLSRRFLLLLALIVGPEAVAQDFPNRPITIIVPFPPGASTDAVARLLRDGMSKVLGQAIVVENRGGAGGTSGSAFVANAAPDGYTLLVTVSAPMTMNKYMQRNFPYDPAKAFAPVSILVESALFLAVHPSLPVRTVPEFIEYGKKNPGGISYGSAGVGSAHHIAGELLEQRTGINMVHVPYQGGGPAIQELIKNQIPVSFGTAPAVLPFHQQGLIRVIATTRATRLPDLQEIPTISETLPGVATVTWLGLFAPAGTPAPVVAKLNAAVRQTVGDPDLVQKFKLQGMTAASGAPAELQARVDTELEMWGKVIPSIGISPE